MYASDTTSNSMFCPEHCVGHSPTVCVSGPQFNSKGMSCARALITGNHMLVKTCKIKLERTDAQTIIEMIKTNQYALATWSENIIVRCPGEKERSYNLKLGLYN